MVIDNTTNENINFVGNVENLDSSEVGSNIIKKSLKTPSARKVVKPGLDKSKLKKSPLPKGESSGNKRKS